MQIAICGEYGSANLGDAIIGMSLVSLLRRLDKISTINSFDLSSRRGEAKEVRVRRRTKIHRLFDSTLPLYGSIYNIIQIRQPLLSLHYDIGNYDLLIIGGGQLLMDNRLNFPLKLQALIKKAETTGTPTSFFSVGVGERWSLLGKKLLREIVGSHVVCRVACRDELSAARLKALVPKHAHKVSATVDVALALPHPRLTTQRRKAVGVGVIHPYVIRRIDKTHPLANVGRADKFWSGLYAAMLEKSYDPILFCNGEPGDADYVNRLTNIIKQQNGAVRHFIPTSATQLIEFIGSLKAIVAARMHANIVAYALDTPNMAIEWDDKVASFMRYVGRQDYLVQKKHLSPKDVLEVLSGTVFQETVVNIDFSTRLLQDISEVVEHTSTLLSNPT